jgi:hypothetical protein
MDVGVLALETELPAPLDELVMPPIGTRPSMDEDADGGMAEFMPGLRDPLVTVTTAVAVSIINDSGILFESKGFNYNSVVSLLEGIIGRENNGVNVVNYVVLLRGGDIITIVVTCEPMVALPASLLASLLESQIGLSSITLL